MTDPRIAGPSEPFIHMPYAPERASCPQMYGVFLDQIECFSAQLKVALELSQRLQSENERLQLENSELKGRVSTQPPLPGSFLPSNIDKAEEVYLMDPAVLYAHIRAGKFRSSQQYDWLSKKQWKQLPLSEMSDYQISLMFPVTFDAHMKYQYTERMRLIKPKELHRALVNGTINSQHIFSFIPHTHLEGLKLSQMDARLAGMLALANGKDAVSDKLRSIGSVEVYAAILARNLMYEDILTSLPPEHYKELPLSKMTPFQIKFMFPQRVNKPGGKWLAYNIQLVDANEVHAAVIEGKIGIKNQDTYYLFRYISSQQLIGFPLSKLDSLDTLRILAAHQSLSITDKLLLIGETEVYAAMLADKLNSDAILTVLPENFLFELPLTEMSSTQIQHLFPSTTLESGTSFFRNKMKLINPTTVKTALETGLLGGYLRNYIPETIQES